MRKVLLIALVVAALATALVAAGCGSSSSSGSSSAKAGGMTAAQILAKSGQAMTKVTSASFTADVTLKVSSTGSSAQTALLGQAPIVLHVAGKAGDKSAGDGAVVAMTLKVSGQTLVMGLKTVGPRTWLGFQGKWYVVPPSKTAGAKNTGTSSSKVVGSLGIDPQKWAASSTVTTEQLDGATVYHVVSTADTAKVMVDIVNALNSPALSKATGSSAATLNRLKSSGELKSLEKSLVSASTQSWIDAKTFMLLKGTLAAKLQLSSGSSTQGVSGLGIDVAYTLGNLGQPVTVTPPAHALPLKALTSGLSSLTSGAGAGL
jgi:hypothetical protein